MGNKSDRRIFRGRRRRVSLVLFASLGILLLGGLLLASFTGIQQLSSGGSAVERVEVPLSAAAPGAVEQVVEEEQPDQAMAEQEAVAKDNAAENVAEEQNKAEENKAQEQNEAGEQNGAGGNGGQRQAENNSAAPAEAKPDTPPPPQDKTTYLTVPKMGLSNSTVYNSSDPTTMDVGATKLEESAFPWEDSANPYISAHRLGWPGTASHYQFYNLPLMTYGDPIYLTDANGTTYTYEVTEIIEVTPDEVWVSEPVAGRDMISLQTCTEDYGDYWTMGPTWSTRYVVRGDRVDVSYA